MPSIISDIESTNMRKTLSSPKATVKRSTNEGELTQDKLTVQQFGNQGDWGTESTDSDKFISHTWYSGLRLGHAYGRNYIGL